MSNDKMREEFEAWAVSEGYARDCMISGHYIYAVTSAAWNAWQASRAAPDVAGLFCNSSTGEHFPRIGSKYIVRIKGVLQEELFEFDQSDDGNGGGEYFWGRDDIDECPPFDWEHDEWMPLSALAAHRKGNET